MNQEELLAADRGRICEIGARMGMPCDPETTGDEAGWARYADLVVGKAGRAVTELIATKWAKG